VDDNFRGSLDTSRKLDSLAQYLQAYSTALKNKGFARIYIDAFAGSGTRTETIPALPLFGVDTPQEIDTPGSATIALGIEPPFDTLAFFEADPTRFKRLEALRQEHSHRNVSLRQGDANDYVRRVCQGVPWHTKTPEINGMRGVVFLDPYGMEVEWETVEAIGKTEALDCWYFFPLSGLYRNAPHDPTKLDQAKQDALDRVLGTRDWRTAWYKVQGRPQNLFESPEDATVRADVDSIEKYVGDRLRTVFKGVVLPPMRLRHNGKAPMASLFFCVSNPNKKATELATRIANHILKAGISSQVRS
jgi:three-Cys-motif partner protein